MSREIEERIAEAAARQHGVVSYHQLVELGVSPSAIDRRLRSGRSSRLHHGVYLAMPFALPHTRAMAAVLACGPGAVVSHLSAAALWGLVPGAGAASSTAATAPVEITVVGNRGRRAGIRVHRVASLRPEEKAIAQGIPVTAPARTLIDLAGIVGARELESAVAWAEREGLATADALSALLARHRRQAGTRALRAVLEAQGGPALTRSSAETKFLALIRAAGLPAPECNVEVGPYEIDFLWRTAGIAAEVDGFRYHSSRPRFESDRRKDARLLAAGITVIRLSWRQITDERIATAVQLGQALARADSRR